LENSIDAGATEIQVEIREGGQRLLQVVDNGQGIPQAELALALERHATSKVRQVEDLAHIQTFGFRGEALYSIAAVSHLSLSSRHQDAEFGMTLMAEGGQVVSQKPAGLPVGTVVKVEHLFYNVPARQKYLRRATTEAGYIRGIVQRLALVHPDRRFSLVVDGKLVFQSTGSGDPFDVLVKIYGLQDARQMIPLGKERSFEGQDAQLPEEVDFMGDEWRSGGNSALASGGGPVLVSGYVSLPVLNRATRGQIDLFVNRRAIEDRNLSHAVIQAYHTLLPVGRYPLAALFIEMDPDQMDVNVHPRKAEVRFQNPRQVYTAVQAAVRRAVIEQASVPDLSLPGVEDGGGVGWGEQSRGLGWTPRSPITWEGEATSQQSLDLPPRPEARPPLPASSPLAWDDGDEVAPSGMTPADVGGATSPGPDPEPSPLSPQRGQPAHPPSQEAKGLPPLRVIGQVGAMYVVAEGPEGIYLIDQHAAHERIMFERFMEQRQAQGISRQGLLTPLTLHVGDQQAGLVAEHLDSLNRVGFDVAPFGGETFLVRAVPSALAEQDAERLLDEMLAGLADARNLVGEEMEARLVKMVCKRASIKAGQILSDLEMKELVRQLEACRSPRTCPHGRPTMIQLSATELEKAFKRV
jgi:DNA mismatch repair protein MutL